MFRYVQMKNNVNCENEKTSIFVFFRFSDIEQWVKVNEFSIFDFENFKVDIVSNVVVFWFTVTKFVADATNAISTNEFAIDITTKKTIDFILNSICAFECFEKWKNTFFQFRWFFSEFNSRENLSWSCYTWFENGFCFLWFDRFRFFECNKICESIFIEIATCLKNHYQSICTKFNSRCRQFHNCQTFISHTFEFVRLWQFPFDNKHSSTSRMRQNLILKKKNWKFETKLLNRKLVDIKKSHHFVDDNV